MIGDNPDIKQQDIHGIPCSLTDNRLCEIVSEVLDSIAKEHPVDYERLQQVVLLLQPYSGDVNDGTLGEWKKDHQRQHEEWTDIEYGWLELNEPELMGKSHDFCVGTVAHEFGHAASLDEDLEARGDKLIPDEWLSEMTADWYATRWGFRNELGVSQVNRDHLHHGPKPGETFTLYCGTTEYHGVVSEDFVARVVKVSEASPDKLEDDV